MCTTTTPCTPSPRFSKIRAARDGVSQELLAAVEEASAAAAEASTEAEARAASLAALAFARLDLAAPLREDLIDEEGDAAHLASLLPGLRDAFGAFGDGFSAAMDALVCDAGSTAAAMAQEEADYTAAVGSAIEASDVELRDLLHGLDGAVKRIAALTTANQQSHGSATGSSASVAILMQDTAAAEAKARACSTQAIKWEVALHSRIEAAISTLESRLFGLRSIKARVSDHILPSVF